MKIMAILVLAAILCFQGIADASMVAGKVLNINTEKNEITITTPSATGAMEDAILSIAAETKFLGATSIADINQGDVISATVTEKTVEGAWKATSISKPTPVTAMSTTPAAGGTAPAAPEVK